MSELFWLRNVPDPTGQLSDLLEELIDNGALVEVEYGIEGDVWESKPAETDLTYYITILADEPLDSVRMHGKAVLVPVPDADTLT